MLYNDSIVALATPSGAGLLQSSISGAEAITGNSVFKSKQDLTKQKTHTLHLGILSTIKKRSTKY
jgi:tRNA modification GTPase